MMNRSLGIPSIALAEHRTELQHGTCSNSPEGP